MNKEMPQCCRGGFESMPLVPASFLPQLNTPSTTPKISHSRSPLMVYI